MAPNLAQSQHSQISDMLGSKSLKAHEIAEAVNCSPRSVKSNIRRYGSTKAPSNGGGHPRNIRPVMLDALCDHLLENPYLYQDRIVLFLLNVSRVVLVRWSWK